MAGLEGGMGLVIEGVQQSGQPPQLGIAVKPGRVGAHGGLDGEHMPPQRVTFRPFAKKVPGLLARKLHLHGRYPSSALGTGRPAGSRGPADRTGRCTGACPATGAPRIRYSVVTSYAGTSPVKSYPTGTKAH